MEEGKNVGRMGKGENEKKKEKMKRRPFILAALTLIHYFIKV
jgi:hypothetical protein